MRINYYQFPDDTPEEILLKEGCEIILKNGGTFIVKLSKKIKENLWITLIMCFMD